jgi:hypothetical protein
LSAESCCKLPLFLGVGFWRHWQAYEALRNVATEFEHCREILKPRHHEMAQAAAAAWPGYRTFHVERKVLEDACAQICSFYLVPEDGKPLPPFLPGQFLTFQLDAASPTGGPQSVIRCYSLSDAPQPNSYRVSVKRATLPLSAATFPAGISSNYFHDHVEVGSTLQGARTWRAISILTAATPGGADRRWHWHHAHVEHVELVPGGTCPARGVAVLRCAQQGRAGDAKAPA